MKLSSQKRSREKTVELSMTSMIDVVFLLLIFFIATATFVRPERNLDSAIKVKSKGGQSSPMEPVIVEVTQGAGGDFVFKLGSAEIDSQETLTRQLSQFPDKSEGAFVKVSDDAPFRMSAAAIQACKSAGFAAVSYVPE